MNPWDRPVAWVEFRHLLLPSTIIRGLDLDLRGLLDQDRDRDRDLPMTCHRMHRSMEEMMILIKWAVEVETIWKIGLMDSTGRIPWIAGATMTDQDQDLDLDHWEDHPPDPVMPIVVHRPCPRGGTFLIPAGVDSGEVGDIRIHTHTHTHIRIPIREIEVWEIGAWEEEGGMILNPNSRINLGDRYSPILEGEDLGQDREDLDRSIRLLGGEEVIGRLVWGGDVVEGMEMEGKGVVEEGGLIVCPIRIDSEVAVVAVEVEVEVEVEEWAVEVELEAGVEV